MTTVAAVQLVAPVQLAGSDGVLYTVPTLTTAKIGRAVFTNTDTSVHTISAGITTGGALTATTTMISARSIAPGETYVSPELAGAVLPAGSALRGFADTGAKVGVEVSGLTIV